MSLDDWIESSLNDLNRAQMCLKMNDFECTCFYSQQAVEKILKAYLLKYGNFLKTHSLVKLAQRCSNYGLDLSNFVQELKNLEIHYSAARYPNAKISYRVEYSEELAKWCLETAIKIINIVLKLLREKNE